MIWIIIAAVILLIILWKCYKIKYDTVIAFTGGLGSGKSFLSVSMAVKLLRKNRRKVKWHNRKEKIKHFFKKSYEPKLKEKPLLYSSIPVRVSGKEWAQELKESHLLLTSHIVEKSVVFIDEVGSFASQFEYNNPNIKDNFDEFVRLFRHYTKGGYLVVNDQCSENIVLQIRRRINTVFNLMHFKKWFGIVYTVKVRNISISEEIKTVEELDTEDNMTTKIGFMPLFLKRYDTYCYSERYITVPHRKLLTYNELKKYNLLTVSKKQRQKLTTNEKPEGNNVLSQNLQ